MKNISNKELQSLVDAHVELIKEGAETWDQAANDIRSELQCGLGYLVHIGIMDTLRIASKCKS